MHIRSEVQVVILIRHVLFLPNIDGKDRVGKETKRLELDEIARPRIYCAWRCCAVQIRDG